MWRQLLHVDGEHISLPCGCIECCMPIECSSSWGWSPQVLLHGQLLAGSKHCAVSAFSVAGYCSARAALATFASLSSTTSPHSPVLSQLKPQLLTRLTPA